MKIIRSEEFQKNLETFPLSIRKKFYKQAGYLLNNLRHPSLHAKKYDETYNIWQARVDRDIRFYFRIEDDRYVLLAITKHPK